MVEVSTVQHVYEPSVDNGSPVQDIGTIGLFCMYSYHTLTYQLISLSLSLSLSLSAVTCPTDSRKRPDQRLLEEGNVDAASSEKYRLEEKQRAARRLRQSRKEEWKPRCVCVYVGGLFVGVDMCGIWVGGWVGCACVWERWRMA